MKIKRDNKPPIRFKELNCGDVFGICDDVCLKIDNHHAYNLQENSLELITCNEEVVKLQAELSVW